MRMDHEEGSSLKPASIAAGGILLLFGVMMLLSHADMVPFNVGRLAAPIVLIALGTTIVLERGALVAGRVDGRPRRRGDPWSGLWLVGVGIWMLVSETRLFGLSYATSWPLLVILSGIMMVARGLTCSCAARRGRTS